MMGLTNGPIYEPYNMVHIMDLTNGPIYEPYNMVHIMINLFSGLYEAARLEKVWERYGREMSLLKGLEPTQNFTIQVQHYHDVVAEAQIVAIENLKHIDSKCTNYWTLFNAFYFSATGEHG